jgi:NAD(P)-dependent dehydrogenase (short-subunit alcohol dehydrogenase family)
MPARFAGKVALVTGASSGIGRATALAFAREGAGVVLANRTAQSGRQVAELIAAGGGEALWVQADVTQASQVQALVAAAVARFGRLDCAFNNAGGGVRRGTVADCTEADWDYTMDSYLKSVWLCMKYEIQQMLTQADGGAIVNNSSVDGLRAFAASASYSAAKHGVVGLTRTAAVQYARQRLRINAVCPGWIQTPPVERYLAGKDEARQAVLAEEPIGRVGQPEEVAQAVLWLCSPEATFVLGHPLAVDGGYLA